MTLFDKIKAAQIAAHLLIKKNTSITERELILVKALMDAGVENFEVVGEKPSAGANLSIIEMKDKFRVNYRCGYSRHNYAPCIEIKK